MLFGPKHNSLFSAIVLVSDTYRVFFLYTGRNKIQRERRREQLIWFINMKYALIISQPFYIHHLQEGSSFKPILVPTLIAWSWGWSSFPLKSTRQQLSLTLTGTDFTPLWQLKRYLIVFPPFPNKMPPRPLLPYFFFKMTSIHIILASVLTYSNGFVTEAAENITRLSL